MEPDVVLEEAVAIVPEPRLRPEADQVGEALPLYLQEIGRVRLLTGAQEVELATAIESGVLAREELSKAPSPSLEDVDLLTERIRAGEDARRRLIEANLRLVVSVARRYMNRGLALADLIQEGNIG